MDRLILDSDGKVSLFKVAHREITARTLKIVGRGKGATMAHAPEADFAIMTGGQVAYFQKTIEMGPPWDRDISDELAHNENCPGVLCNGWWQRTVEQINGLTFHHTLSNSPHAMARYYVTKDGGRPSIPYTIWITETGEILLCNALTEGVWHDHTGHKNTRLAVGLAGQLHIHHPSGAQLDAAAEVALWAIETLPGIKGVDQIKGHMDVGKYKDNTECPGWNSHWSGFWKPELYERIIGF